MQVYLIRNKVNGKAYVGQTTRDIDTRWREHCLTQGKCRILENAIRKYGIDAFEVSVVATVSTQDELNRLERLTCEALNTYAPHGYNLREGGGAKGRMHEQTKQIIRELALQPERLAAFHEMRRRPEVVEKNRAAAKRDGASRRACMVTGHTPEVEQRRTEAVAKAWNQKRLRDEQSARQKEIQARPEVKAQKSATLAANWAGLTDDQRAARGRAISASLKGHKKKIDYSPEAKVARREVALKKWQDPTMRAKRAATFEKLLSDPDFLKRRGEAIRAALAAKKLADPDFLKRRAALAVAARKPKEPQKT